MFPGGVLFKNGLVPWMAKLLGGGGQSRLSRGLDDPIRMVKAQGFATHPRQAVWGKLPRASLNVTQVEVEGMRPFGAKPAVKDPS